MTDNLFEQAKEQARAAGKAIGENARQLGAVAAGGDIPARTAEAAQLADRAMVVLRDEVELLTRVRLEFAEEKRAGAPALSTPRLDAMAARLEGMTRMALLLELIAPAEARVIWTEARGAGVRDRPAPAAQDPAAQDPAAQDPAAQDSAAADVETEESRGSIEGEL